MAKVKITTSGLIETVKRAFKNVGQDVSMYVDIINFSVERIKQRARLSKRMENGGGEVKLPTLSERYIEQRKQLKPGEADTDPTFFRPSSRVSNMTFTGQLLKGLQGKINKTGSDVGKMSLEFTGDREQTHPLDPRTNAEVYERLLERDENYRILALNKKATENIRKIVLTRIRQELVRMRLKK